MITYSTISYGDQLGAQMTSFSELVYIAKENKQDICFFNELKNFRRRYRIIENFDLPEHLKSGERIKFLRRFYLPIPELYCLQFRDKTTTSSLNLYKKIYKSKIQGKLDSIFFRFCKLFYHDFEILVGKNNVNCNPEFLKLDKKKNYDIQSGLGTFQDWKKYQDEICDLFKFKQNICSKGDEIYSTMKTDKPTVSVHFRKGDYLLLSSLNLDLDYYKKAISYFDKDKYKLVIFSDDIESCKCTGVFDGYDIHFMQAHSASLDMYIMSLCDNNIIANSSFSFWGALLNKNKNKKVICPHDFVGQSSPENLYINGNWYPEEWIAL